MSTLPDEGVCSVCERTTTLKADGNICRHGIIGFDACEGSDQPPLVFRCKCGYATDTEADLDGHILGTLSIYDDTTKEPEHREVSR